MNLIAWQAWFLAAADSPQAAWPRFLVVLRCPGPMLAKTFATRCAVSALHSTRRRHSPGNPAALACEMNSGAAPACIFHARPFLRPPIRARPKSTAASTRQTGLKRRKACPAPLGRPDHGTRIAYLSIPALPSRPAPALRPDVPAPEPATWSIAMLCGRPRHPVSKTTSAASRGPECRQAVYPHCEAERARCQRSPVPSLGMC